MPTRASGRARRRGTCVPGSRGGGARRRRRAGGGAGGEGRVELPPHAGTVELAERLEADGIPVVRRYTFLLVGAVNEDAAKALAERLRREAPAGARVDVQPGGGVAWGVGPP